MKVIMIERKMIGKRRLEITWLFKSRNKVFAQVIFRFLMNGFHHLLTVQVDINLLYVLFSQ